jgi:transcription antitermination protein NusB
MVAKRKIRELMLQWLFSHDFNLDMQSKAKTALFMEMANVTKKNIKEIETEAQEIIKNIDFIDKIIEESSKDYKIERILLVEKNILRIAIFELYYSDNPEIKIIISEAIRLAKKFSTTESLKFVNAVLDNIYKTSKK